MKVSSLTFDDYKGGTIGLDLDLHMNIASLTKKRQSFLVLGGTASLIPIESRIFDFAFWDDYYNWKDHIPAKSWVAGLFYGYVGYLKRIYLGPLAIHGENLFGNSNRFYRQGAGQRFIIPVKRSPFPIIRSAHA
jgi:hypothetical protein